jgi:hypothetical protein
MFEAFVLVCLLGKPTLDENCEQLADTRGPYMTLDQCLARVYEIKQELHLYRPNMEARAYRCDEFTPQTEKQRT